MDNTENPNSIASEEYLVPLASSGSLLTVKSDMISSPSLESGPDRDQMGRMLQEVICDKNDYNGDGVVVEIPQASNNFETSFIMPQPKKPPSKRNGTLFHFSTGSQKHSHPRECQERLLSPLERQRSKSSSPKQHAHRKASSCSSNSLSKLKSESIILAENQNVIPLEPLQSTTNPQQQKYPNNRFSAFESSEKSSSSPTSSSSTNSSTNGAGNNSGASTASTLPLHPSTLPQPSTLTPLIPIPPPILYSNLDVNTDQPYVIPETREHREISC